MNRGRRRPPVGPRTTAEVAIASIAAGGEGVGRLPDGRAIFVHRTAPGERALVRVEKERGSWARGSLIRILEESADRRPAPCPHYADCGGCTLEHLQYAAQIAAKAAIVRDSLARIGKVDMPLPAVVPSPREYHYRNRVSFALRRLGSGRVVAGFHGLSNPDRITEIDGSCLLPEEPIGRAWDDLRRVWGPDANRLPSGERLRLTLRATSSGRISLLIEGGYSEGRMDELLGKVEGLDSVWHSPAPGVPRLIAGAPGLPETWGSETFDVTGAAFLQVNRSAAALLEEYVVTVAGDVRGRNVVDAYCGIGLHARRLARAGARVTGIELDPEAVRSAASSNTPCSTFMAGPVEELIGSVLPADLVILNPPRAGVDAAVIEQILAAPPRRIIYISCDPSTLARDVKRLGTAYRLLSLRCFDLFPQTAHVETVAELVPTDSHKSHTGDPP